MSGPRIGELFAGYGGLGMGVQAALGGEMAWYSEIDKGALKILDHRFPDVPNVGDITTVDWSQVEPVDIITGGFPCTDLSKIGGRAGLRPGTRSGLWSHMANAVYTLQPRLVVAENVRGLLSGEASSDLEPCPMCMGDARTCAMRALGVVLADLAELGYDAQWTSLRASDVGAPHERERIFLVAAPADADRVEAGLRPVVVGGDAGEERRSRPTDDRHAGRCLALLEGGQGDPGLDDWREYAGVNGRPSPGSPRPQFTTTSLSFPSGLWVCLPAGSPTCPVSRVTRRSRPSVTGSFRSKPKQPSASYSPTLLTRWRHEANRVPGQHHVPTHQRPVSPCRPRRMRVPQRDWRRRMRVCGFCGDSGCDRCSESDAMSAAEYQVAFPWIGDES